MHDNAIERFCFWSTDQRAKVLMARPNGLAFSGWLDEPR
jgi:hypothetical protein